MAKASEFNRLYSRLNKGQKEAVDSIEGPVMVIAGPGTGKTLVLTLRIANVLKKTDTEPESILALTFTEAAANEMRRRLVNIIGSAAWRVGIYTFHGFCNEVIQTWPEYFPRIIGSNVASNTDQVALLKKIIEKEKLDLLKPFGNPFFYLHSILSAISELKRENISVDEFKKALEEEEKNIKNIPDKKHTKGMHKGKVRGFVVELQKNLAKNKELAFIYQKYEQTLAKHKLYDYNDMIVEVVRELKSNPELLLLLQERYLYLLADEHQDANRGQNQVLELLASYHKNPNLFVVGDQKQAIFRFQGASLENFNYFKNLYREAKIVILEENYRSTQTILDAASSLVGKDSKDQRLKSASKGKQEKIKVFEFSNHETEYYFLAKSIKEKLKKEVNPSEIAILYRSNLDGLRLAQKFEHLDIPFILESDQDVLADPDIKKLVVLLRAINGFGDQSLLVDALHIDFLDFEPLEVYKLLGTSKGKEKSLFDLLKKPSKQFATKKAFAEFYKKLANWHKKARNYGLSGVFVSVVNGSGFINYLLGSSDSAEKMEKLNVLYDEIKAIVERNKNATLKDFIDYLDMLESENMSLNRTLGAHKKEHARLMTAHRSKGREFDVVYILHAAEGHWSGRRGVSLFKLPFAGKDYSRQEIEDERRLFYVALTRARKQIIITHARQSLSGKERLHTRFIDEIKSELTEFIDTKKHEEDFEKESHLAFSIITDKTSAGAEEKKLFFDLFSRRGFSVTHLNNYLKCPWRYFYVNLLRIPELPTKHQFYGIAIHSALKNFFDKLRLEEDVNSKILTSFFIDSLNSQPTTKQDHKEIMEKGTKSLKSYYNYYKNFWRINTINEFNVRGVQFLPELTLVGKLDKVEFFGEGGEVNVVDYKTGRPRSRNEILGKTKNSDGDYFRQLVFYKILLDGYSNGKYRMVSGEIDFIEPTKSGSHKKERFEISDADIKELKEQIKDVAAQIKTLSFWDKRCEDAKCRFCGLRELGV